MFNNTDSLTRTFAILLISFGIFFVLIIAGIIFFQQKVLTVGEGAQFTKIQSAIDASSSGDIIIISSSLSPYEEILTIGAGKDRLKLIGIGGPVLDGTTFGLGVNGITISDSSNIHIKGLTIRNYEDDDSDNGAGILVEDTSSRNIFVKNKLVENGFEGIFSFGSHSFFIRNEFNQNGGEGIDSQAGNSLFIGNNFVQNGFMEGFTVDAFDIHENNNLIIGNKLFQNADDAMDVKNDFNLILGNIASLNEEGGLIMEDESSHNLIIGNRWLDNVEDGIILDDEVTDTVVIGNKVIGNERDGIRVGDLTRNNIIQGNKIIGNERGVFIRNNDPTFSQENKVTHNKIVQSVEQGVFLGGATDNIILNNKIKDNGAEGILLDIDEDEFMYEATDNTIIRNKITNSGTDGISLTADTMNNQVLQNHISRSILLAIRDAGVNNVFNGNICETSDPATICTNLITE
ncbi:right-handed parallel beta-helix repeat-containing protein [Bacillus solimangrovi]|uniref:Right handed beta helix domain-containing protein n=1 Tax=Bacillus solimangrovi TaxID=1305675 RepID=A0A1E5LDB5_9BACI|nr:right-handed parallel beta-helix repeat-containing protein [Bacillus solimangrovi]OEH92087.1 hypothetical protein BFG57_16785 [Bacillus solimangrovi]